MKARKALTLQNIYGVYIQNSNNFGYKMKYYIWSVDQWVKCKRAKEASKGWLEYELADGTTGLARPSQWQKTVRALAAKEARPVGRPRMDKIKVMLSVDAGIVKAIDERAAEYGLNRSAFIEVLLRAELAKKQSGPK